MSDNEVARPPLTPKRISELAKKAYRLLGYKTMTFGDGSTGVLRCPPKTVALMNVFQDLLMHEVAPGAGGEAVVTIDPPECGCTDCLAGRTKPAASLEEYERAKAKGRAR